MKAQGATEYLVIMSVVLGIALICVAILVWPTGTTKDVKTSQTDIKCGIAKNSVPDIMQGMVAYYKFDEGSGTAAYNRKTGVAATLTNGPTWAIGKSGSALSFDGLNDYVTAGNILNMDTGPFSISAWIKTGSSAKTTILSKKQGYESPGNIGYTFGLDDSRLAAEVEGTSTNVILRHLGSYYGDNQWYHVMVVYTGNGGTLTLYKNGANVGSTSATPGNLTNNINLIIGAEGGLGRPFNGTIDEVLIYNHVLNADELKYLYEYPGCP